MYLKHLTCAVCAAGLCSPAGAAETAPIEKAEKSRTEVSLYLGVGLDFGGDDIVRVEYVGGGSDEVEAGAGVHLAIGADLDIDRRYLVRGTLGYKVDEVIAENGEIKFRRLPLELTAYRFFGRHGLGGGVSRQLNPKYSCDISGVCDGFVKLRDTSGLLVEYLYRNIDEAGRGYSVGVRASSGIDYKPQGGAAEAADGDFVGINLGIIL